MRTVTLALADPIADATSEAGARRAASPLTVAVLDAGGHVVVMKRSDNSGILRCEIAYGKAWGALGMGLPTRTLGERAKATPSFFAAIAASSEGRLIPVPGGVLLRNDSGAIIGAVGVSGDTSDIDEECAMEAIAACSCVGDNGTA